MNSIMIFENPEFGRVRSMKDEKGEIWFVGKDVAEALSYVAPRNAILNHVSEDDKKDVPIQCPLGGTQKMILINRSERLAATFQ